MDFFDTLTFKIGKFVVAVVANKKNIELGIAAFDMLQIRINWKILKVNQTTINFDHEH